MSRKVLACSAILSLTLLQGSVVHAVEEYFFRPYEELQGSGAGTSYDNAWRLAPDDHGKVGHHDCRRHPVCLRHT